MKILILKVVDWDGNIIHEEWSDYSGQVAECKPGKSTGEKTGFANSTTLFNENQADQTAANQEVKTAETDPTSSPLYRSLLTSGTDATNDAYNNAKAATNLHANMSGFGATQPMTGAADAGIESSRAGDLSRLPSMAMMANLGQANTDANRLDKQGATDLGGSTDFFKTANDAEQKRLAATRAMWSSLAKAGLMAAAPFTGGLSAAMPGAMTNAAGGM